ncbi:hypothetical protein BH23VER1_BH23VER1_01060 [soil metagenome]
MSFSSESPCHPASRWIAAAFLVPCLPLVVPAAAEIDFAHQVVPILKKHCQECHLGEDRKGGFSMNTREDLLEGSEDGPVLEAGKPGSLLVELLRSTDPDEWMPPKGERLPPEEIAALDAWIQAGAPWEPGFSFGESGYEPPLEPRIPALPPVAGGRTHPVDRLVDAHLAANDVPRPAPLGDAAFMRRLSLDLIGLLPEPAALEAFVADPAPDKREKLIAATLADDLAYAEHWLTFWNDLLRNDYVGTGYIDGGRTPITSWLYQALLTNKPYDAFARELLAPPTPESSGFINGIKWRGSVNASQEREVQFAQSISQTFLGLNMKCASCHDSFVDRWKLDEAYGLAAIIADEPLEIARCDVPTGRTAKAAWIFPELGEVDPAAPKDERLQQLAALMTHPENGRFTRTLVNRLWHRLMGRGIVHPVDAMDTEPWSADLLDFLAHQFAQDGYDTKKALAFIASSEIYQSESVAAREDDQTFRGPLAKRLTAEQFVDAVWSLTGTAPDQPHENIPRPGTAMDAPLHAKWIWSDPQVEAPARAGETIVLGTEVNLPAAPTAVRAAITCDNHCQVFVNGQPVAETGEWFEVGPLELGGFQAGRNTVVVVAHNGGTDPNPAGLFFEARAEFPEADPVVIASDATWRWSATLPDAQGRFAAAPQDWQPAAEVANPAVWSRADPGLRSALQVPGGQAAPMVRASLVPADLLMRALGRPNREQIVSMRPDTVTTLEAIDLANGEILADLLRRGAAGWARSGEPADALVRTAFLRALSRLPSRAESAILVAELGPDPTPAAIEDLLWVLLLSPEFQFVH